MRVTVDADVELGCPAIAWPGWPVHHSHLQPLEAALHLHGEPWIVGRVAIDHGQRLEEPAKALQDRVLLPVPGVPDLVDVGETFTDEVEQSLNAVPSLGVTDEPEPQHQQGA